VDDIPFTVTGLPDLTSDIPRPHIEKYEILEKLDEGGMGIVYKARQQGVNRLVALKTMRPGRDTDPALIARFKLEVEAVGRLQHPNFVQIYDVGEADGRPFYVMEFVEGANLREVCGHRPQAPEVAARLVEVLARAMHHAHQQNIVHRDLKPSNVLMAPVSRTRSEPGAGLSGSVVAVAPAQTSSHDMTSAAAALDLERWVPKISDFGLAKLLDVDCEQTRTNQTVGSPHWMAPEQLPGKGRRITPLVDVYALGAILYALLTGRPPIQGHDAVETLTLLPHQEPVPPRQLQPGVPIDLETITLKCLRKEPASRYASAEALADDLRSFLDGKPIKARPISRAGRVWRWCRRNPVEATLGIVLASVLLLGSVGGVVLAAWALQGEKNAKENAKKALVAERLAQSNAEESKKKEQLSRHKSYALSMSRAYEDWKKGRLIEVLRRLEEQKTIAANTGEPVGFEWHYLNGLCHLELQSFTAPHRNIWCVAASPDGCWLASGEDDGTLRIWKTSTGKPVRAWKGHRGRVRSLAFSPDGKHFASAGLDGKLCLWSVLDEQDTRTIPAHDGDVWSVAYSDDGKWLATASGDESVKVWIADTGAPICTFRGHKDSVHCVRFGPEKLWLASAGEDGSVRIWDLSTRLQKPALGGDLGRIFSLAISPDGQLIAAGTETGRLIVWNFATREVVLDKSETPDEIRSLAFDPEGTRLLLGLADGTARVWDLKRREQLLVSAHENLILGVAYTAKGRKVITATPDEIKSWDAATSHEYWMCAGHLGEVYCLTYAPSGRRLASGASDHNVIVWDSEKNVPWRTFPGHTGTVLAVAFAADESYLASASEDQTVRIWDVKRGALEHKLEGHQAAVRGVAFGPNMLVASGSDDGTVRLWNGVTGSLVAVLDSGIGEVKAVAFSPDGRLLAWAGQSNTVRVWDLTRKKQVCRLVGRNATGMNNPMATTIAFSRDSRYIACAGNCLVIEIWDLADTSEPRSLLGHRAWISGVAFSPDGTRLASASSDGTAKLWDAMTGDEILSFGGGGSGYQGVAFHPNCHQLACASLDWWVQVWDSRTDTAEHRSWRDARSLVQFLYTQSRTPAEVISHIRVDASLSEEVKEKALSLAPSYGRVQLDREATKTVKLLFDQGLFREEVLGQLRQDPSLAAPFRLRTLDLAAVLPENARAMARASWLVVRQPTGSEADVSRAVKQAEAAYRLSPRSGTIPTTLGVAYYRAGRYQEAKAVLESAEQLYAAADSGCYPPNSAVLSMCYLKLGEPETAKSLWARCRRTAQSPPWTRSPEGQRFLREADAVFQDFAKKSSR
jgi:WD40 repeat protein/serine/threonine protein kinase